MAKTTRTGATGDKGARLHQSLYRRIERLEDRIRVERELIGVEQNRRDAARQARIDKLANRLKKDLYDQELAVVPEAVAVEEKIRVELPKLEARQRLAFRKARQDLRRAEGLVDKTGRLLPDAADLSLSARQTLAELEATQQAERDRLKTALAEQVAKAHRSEGDKAAKKAAYEAKMKVQADTIKAEEARLLAKDNAYMQRFRAAQEARVQTLETKHTAALARLKAERTVTYDLPDDVCLRLDNLSMTFGGLKAVDELSFDIMRGEIFGLIGPNGAGKTTVFNCITQFYKPNGGRILYRTRGGSVLSLANYDVHEIITKGIVRTFQNVEIIGELSVMDNLLIAAHRQYNSGFFAQMLNTHRVRQEEMVMRERALKILDYCGLTAIKDLSPLGQPYGTLKRIELARTLIAGANLIILDEPAAGLNDQETLELVDTIRQIQKDFDVTIFLVEHNMGLVMDLCDHICAISFGKKLAYGSPQQIQSDPVVQEAYLGNSDVADSKPAAEEA